MPILLSKGREAQQPELRSLSAPAASAGGGIRLHPGQEREAISSCELVGAAKQNREAEIDPNTKGLQG